MPVAKDELFFDPHCHAMTIAHPNIPIFLQELSHNFTEEVLSELFSPAYLLDPAVKHPIRKIKNLLAVMEHDVAGIFKLMEDDLQGKFAPDREGMIRDNLLHLRSGRYRQIVITPLVMDFSNKAGEMEDIYYNRVPESPLWKHAREVLEGIREYHRQRPEGMLRIYPFLGINTRNYSLRELEEILKHFFSVYSSSFSFRTETTRLITTFSGILDGVGSNVFSGIKLYPPLGFDPWPEEEPEEMEKVHLLYRFCQKRRIPITTHCDDQGYRTIPVKEAWRNSSPERWEQVLKAYPKLKLNFGHLGRQYYRRFRFIRQYRWMRKIFRLMEHYPHVYGDFSFNGTDPDYYRELLDELEGMDSRQRELIVSRILFGSDFMINLTKVESYLDYLRLFESSPFSDGRLHSFCSSNPRRFLFTEDGALDKVRQIFEKR